MFIFLLLISTARALAQKEGSPDKTRVDFSKFSIHRITLHKPSVTFSPGCMFSDIIVEDNRFDTNTLGFMHKGSVDPKSVIKFKNGFTSEIRNYLITSIDHPVSGYTVSYKLIGVVKKLWLSDEIFNEEDERYLPDTKLRKSGIIFRIEFLAEREGLYTPLYRFDTTITGDKNIYQHGNSYIEKVLMLSLSKLGSFTENQINQIKSKYSWEEIEQYNQQRFNLPVLTGTLSKGVYLTFEEFKNNKPSIIDFVIKPDKKNDDIYIKDEQGKEMLMRDLYGYSDGKDIFISSAGNFFRLYRSGNSFNIFGVKSLKKVRSANIAENAVAGLGLAAVRWSPAYLGKSHSGYNYKLRPAPFQLDMETGNIY